MLTRTITKIARTVELAALLTIGYIATGFFVTPLVLIAVIVVLNDVVTITLATDRSWISSSPERWNVGEIARLGGVTAAGWLILAFMILWFVLPDCSFPSRKSSPDVRLSDVYGPDDDLSFTNAVPLLVTPAKAGLLCWPRWAISSLPPYWLPVVFL